LGVFLFLFLFRYLTHFATCWATLFDSQAAKIDIVFTDGLPDADGTSNEWGGRVANVHTRDAMQNVFDRWSTCDVSPQQMFEYVRISVVWLGLFVL
jgi:hypothetical protein